MSEIQFRGENISAGGHVVGRDKIENTYNFYAAAPARQSTTRSYAAASPSPLPPNFVERPEAVATLREAIFSQKSFGIALTALDGMGGIGKTVLAKALCQDPQIREKFCGGIAWIDIGRESTEKVETRLRRVAAALGEDLEETGDERAAIVSYQFMIRKRAALVVLDDVWNAADVEPFRGDAPASCVLFTTRDRSIASVLGAEEVQADLLSPEQSLAVLARWAKVEVVRLPGEARDLVKECGRLPLALSMVGAYLRNKPGIFWKQTLERLRRAELEEVGQKLPHYARTLTAAMEVSVEALDAKNQERYLKLAVLLEEMAATPAVQESLWGMGEEQAAETAERFISLSLAQREADGQSIKLHDLQLDYVRSQYGDQEALDLIHGAMRLSSHVIDRDPMQFASQLVGRLLAHEDLPGVNYFTRVLRNGCGRPALLPRWPSLDAPGGGMIRTLAGHADQVNGVAMTGDGRRAISASKDQTLKVWDVESGHELRTLAGHTGWIHDVALTGDGGCAVSASSDKTLKVWDLESGRELRTLTGHTREVSHVAVSGDGRHAVSASYDNTLKVWDVKSGREVWTLADSVDVVGVALSRDGRCVVSCDAGGTLKIWDVESGRKLHTLAGHTHWVTGVALSDDGRRAVSSSGDQTLKVWDVESGRELRTLTGHTEWVNGVALSGDGRRAVSASNDQTLKVWDVESGRELRSLFGHTGWVRVVALSRDGRRAVSSSGDRLLKLWDLDRGRELRPLTAHRDVVNVVALSGNGQCAVSASMDHTLKIWDVKSGRELRTLAGHTMPLTGAAISADGQRVISASDDHTLKVWEVKSGRELRTLPDTSPVYGVTLSVDGRCVTGFSDHRLKVWDVESGRELCTLPGYTGDVLRVGLSGNGRRAISASRDHRLKVWDVQSGRELRTLTGHTGYVLRVGLSGNGQRAISASRDQTVKVWDVQSGRELRTLTGHTGDVLAVALSDDGRRAVSAFDDCTLRQWDVESGRVIGTFTCEGIALCCVCTNSGTIIAGDWLGRVYMVETI